MKKFHKSRLIFVLVVVAMLFGIAATLSMKLPAMASTSCGQVLVKASSWLGGHGVDVRSNGTNMHTKQACEADGEVYNLSANPPQYGFAWDSVELVNRLYVTKGWSARLTIPATYNGKATNSGAKWLYTLAAAGYYRGLVAYANGSNYKPVPGDLIVLGNGTFGNVTIVDHINNNTLYAVDQNGSANGWEKFAYNASTGAVSMSGVPISGYVHPTKNKKNNTYVLNSSIVHVSGTLSTNKTWTSHNIYVVDSQLTIPAGITLTISQGTIVKYVSSSSDPISVSSGGTLKVTGTATNPAIFTSYKDDSAGGDTNGDGNASSPATDDYGAAVSVGGSLSNVTVKVAYAEFRYGTQSLSLTCTSDSNVSATVTDSTIGGQIYAYGCEAGQGTLTLQRNHFDVPVDTSSTAIALYYSDPSGVVLAGTNENTFVGSGKAITVFVLGNGANIDLAHGSTWTVASTSGAVLDVQDLSIAGTLNLTAGAIVKIEPNAEGFILDSGGTVKVTGTAANPVIFTSYKDDSVGGDTNGDGPSTGAAGDYSSAIVVGAGLSSVTVSVSRAEFRYGTQSLSLSCASGSNVSATVTDSVIKSQIAACGYEAGQGQLSLMRNQFELAANGPNTAVSLSYSDPSGVVLAGTNENTFVGSGKAITVFVLGNGANIDLAHGSTWTVASTSGAVLDVQDLSIAGTVNLTAGAIVKTEPNAEGFILDSGGTVKATGTSGAPVIFTSYKDDSVGGDTNGDGPSTGAAGDYSSAIVVGAGLNSVTVNVSHAVFKYAYTVLTLSSGIANLETTSISNVLYGLEVSGDAQVTYRGSFGNIADKAITSCNWPTNTSSPTCAVDAAYTYWGADDGPFAQSGGLVCGDVLVNPWRTSSSTLSNSDIFTIGNCDTSETPATSLLTSGTSFNNMIASLHIDCSGGYSDACTALTRRTSCLQSAYNTLKNNEFISFGLPNFRLSSLAKATLKKVSVYVINSVTFKGVGNAVGNLVQGVTLTIDLNNDYNTCFGA